MIDWVLQKILQQEQERQATELEMIASENYVSQDVMQAYANVFTNKYSEGYPGARYYGGQMYVDKLEELTQHRALRLFGLLETAKDIVGFDSSDWISHESTAEKIHRDLSIAPWGVNVQPLSGSPANLAVYMGVLKPWNTVLAMDLQAGGHLTHGHKLNWSAIYYNFISYGVLPDTYEIDYEGARCKALAEKPAMIIVGFSAYPKTIDRARFAAIADEVSEVHGYRPLLMADIAHIAGLIAGGAISSPFPYMDIVTTTTHKTLRGPRWALIYMRKGLRDANGRYGSDSVFRDESVNNMGTSSADTQKKVLRDLEKEINRGVFPGLQGGPHEHIILAKAVAFSEALQPWFHTYAAHVIDNAKTLASELVAMGRDVLTGSTENHMVLFDVTKKRSVQIENIAWEEWSEPKQNLIFWERQPTWLTGKSAERILEEVGISVNKNLLPFDARTPMDPSGIRVGTPAITTRGLWQAEVKLVASIISRALDAGDDHTQMLILKTEIGALCARFPLMYK